MDADNIVELVNKLNELYRDTRLPQKEDDLAVKSNIRAMEFRKKGDEHFLEGSFDHARSSYTFCLAHAEADSEEIGHAYANRSAVLLKMEFFDLCLLDIDRALNSNYPEDKKKSLRERKKRLLASKKAEQSLPVASSRTREVETEWRDKLCNFRNPYIPGASNKIKLESNEKWGRHLVATENIKAGEILSCQKYFTMVRGDTDDCRFGVCSYCLLNHPALIPCPKCTLAMYCSENCRTQAFDSYHRIECQVLRTEDRYKDILGLKCMLVGTGQGAGLASLMKKISLEDMFNVKAKIDEFTAENQFSYNNYIFLLSQCRKLDTRLTINKADFILRIIIALRRAGYFDYVPDRQQRETNFEPSTDKDIKSKVLDSVEPADESDYKKEDPDDGKNKDRTIVQEHADSSTIVGTLSKNTDEQRQAHLSTENASSDSTTAQRKSSTEVTAPPLNSSSASSGTNQQSGLKHKLEAHIDAKGGNLTVYEKEGGISSKVLDSVEVADEGNDKKEDRDGSEIEDRAQEYEDSTEIVGEKFLKEVTAYYCELCLCLCYDQEKSKDEVFRAHCRTPLHLERFSSKTTEEKEVISQECVTVTSLSKTTEEPPLDSTSQPPESSIEIFTASPDTLPTSSDANEQNLMEPKGCVLVNGTSLLRNVNVCSRMDVAKPGPSTATPQDDVFSVDSNANQHQEKYLTATELYASFLLLNHRLWIDNFTFSQKQLCDLDYKHQWYGLGVCILHGLINHSCDPNADFITRGQEMALYALRPISKGEQIFICYSRSFPFYSLQTRQEALTARVGKLRFNCECTACVNKWPMQDDLRKMRQKFLFLKHTRKKAAINAFYEISSRLKGKTADSTSRLEIIKAIGRIREWLHINVERPDYISVLCEQLLLRAMKQFYDTSSPTALTEPEKKTKMLEYFSNIIRSIKL